MKCTTWVIPRAPTVYREARTMSLYGSPHLHLIARRTEKIALRKMETGYLVFLISGRTR